MDTLLHISSLFIKLLYCIMHILYVICLHLPAGDKLFKKENKMWKVQFRKYTYTSLFFFLRDVPKRGLDSTVLLQCNSTNWEYQKIVAYSENSRTSKMKLFLWKYWLDSEYPSGRCFIELLLLIDSVLWFNLDYFSNLKWDSHLPKKIVLFASMLAL